MHICKKSTNFARLFVNIHEEYCRIMKKILFIIACSLSISLTMTARKPAQLFVVGDNTAASRVDFTSTNERGWGQVLPTFLSGVNVRNMAFNAASSKSFIETGAWTKLLENAQRRDYVVIQFGLNDLNINKGQLYSSISEMEHNLLQMIKEAQKKRLNIILTTPISRIRYNTFEDSVFYSSFGAYAEATRRVAKQQQLPLVDLEALTAAQLSQLSHEQIDELYTDGINLTESGALWVAGLWARAALEDETIAKAKIIAIPDTPNPAPIYANYEE